MSASLNVRALPFKKAVKRPCPLLFPKVEEDRKSFVVSPFRNFLASEPRTEMTERRDNRVDRNDRGAAARALAAVEDGDKKCCD